MSARRKRVISTEEIQFNHKPAKMLLTEKKKGVSQNGQTPSIIGICLYCVLDRPVFERCQTLLHPELTPWWSAIKRFIKLAKSHIKYKEIYFFAFQLLLLTCISGWPQSQRPFQGLVEVSQHTVKHSLGLMLHEEFFISNDKHVIYLFVIFLM